MASPVENNPVDVQSSPSPVPSPPTSIDDKNESGAVTDTVASGSSSSPSAPGSFQKSNGNLPEWYNVGWTSFSDLPNPGNEQDLETLKKTLGGSSDALVDTFSTARPDKGSNSKHDLISHFLSEAYYGEWYHNAGVMIFAVASTWVQTKLGGGLMGCLVIGAFLGKCLDVFFFIIRSNLPYL
jgi:hypothetical protein